VELTLSTKKLHDSHDEEWISQAEAARIRGVSRQAIRNLIDRDKLRTLEIGGKVLVSRSEAVEHKPEPPGRPSRSEDEQAIGAIMAQLESAPERIRRSVLNRLRQTVPVHPIEEEFGVSAEVILEAIARSSDISQRGVRGLIAEACFKLHVIDTLEDWKDVTPDGAYPFDFLIAQADQEVSIQLKMLRRKEGIAMTANQANRRFRNDLYAVETQKTRGGKDPQTGEDTRPYRFGEFDILGVAMAPLSGDWTDFRFTVGNWLLPRPDKGDLILKFQPVSVEPNSDWTVSLEECIRWLGTDERRTIGGLQTPDETP
jgi:hypothetical protein